MEQQQVQVNSFTRLCVATLIAMLLAACATEPASVPETTVLADIRATLDEATSPTVNVVGPGSEGDEDLLNELIPSLSLDQNLLTPVEERVTVTSPNLPADVFFNSLVADTDYGVVISEDVDVNINLSLPNVTIEEAMDTIAEIYSLDITRRGNIFTVREGGLRTRQFTVDYLNVQRMGSSSIQVTAGGANQGGAGGGAGGGLGGVSGGLSGGIGGATGGIGGAAGGLGGAAGGLGGAAGGLGGGLSGGGGAGGNGIQTSTSTDFWSDLESAISNLIGIQSSGGGSGGGLGGGLGGLGGLGGGLLGGGGGGAATISEDGKSVLVQPITGLVIVTAYPDELERVEAFLNASQESLRREVIIQVQFLEVVLNKGFQYALDFNTFGQQSNDPVTGSGAFSGDADGLLGSNNRVGGEFSSGEGTIASIAGAFQFSTNFSDFDSVFRILQTRGTTQVLSSPQLRVLNNQKAVFQDGDQEYFQTQADTTTVASGTNTTTNANNNLEQFFSGISMDITPQISANGEITLHVHPIISAVNEQSKNIAGQVVPLPRTSTREIDSVIKAQNGRIVVLGGLAFERNISDTAGIPGVSKIPLVGDALEQRQTQTVKSEFIILLKPIIADADSDREVLGESNRRFRDLNRAIDPFANN